MMKFLLHRFLCAIIIRSSIRLLMIYVLELASAQSNLFERHLLLFSLALHDIGGNGMCTTTRNPLALVLKIPTLPFDSLQMLAQHSRWRKNGDEEKRMKKEQVYSEEFACILSFYLC